VESHIIDDINNIFKAITCNDNITISVSTEYKVNDEPICIITTFPPHMSTALILRGIITELDIDIN